MREPDEHREPDAARSPDGPDRDWALGLRDRVDDVVPAVPIDVDAVVRGGRRRRAARRAAAATGAAAVVVGALLVVPGVAGVLDRDDWPVVLGGDEEGGQEDGSTQESGVARILEDGPDCFAEDVLWQAGLYPGDPIEHPAVAEYGIGPEVGSGRIPPGFDPVAVVHCRLGDRESLRSAVDTVPYEEVTLGPAPEWRDVAGSADVDAFVDELSRPSESWEEMEERAGGEVACAAIAISVRPIFLVDADGRAVRPAWPTDGCGFVLLEAEVAMDRLDPLDVVRYEAVPETWSRHALESASADVMTLLDEEGIAWSWVAPADDLQGLEVSGPRTAADDDVRSRVRDLVAARVGPVPVAFVPDEPALAQAFRPHDPTVQLRWDLMQVEPSVVIRGREHELRVTFPQGTSRGVAYVLEHLWDGWTTAERANSRWLARYHLTSDAAGGEPDGWPIGDGEGRGWEDIGIEGPGPDVVRLPADLEPGSWRLCTANAVENVCASLGVSGR